MKQGEISLYCLRIPFIVLNIMMFPGLFLVNVKLVTISFDPLVIAINNSIGLEFVVNS